MIEIEKFVLDNGLKVVVHRDASTPLAAVNILYDVGAKDEEPDHTGFAHLIEHLMFEGSLNVPCYDEPLEKVGGTNNAFTNNDITNYYISLPAKNLETAFWLESDRMLGLDITEKSLDIQRKVVSEEFRQRYLNQPYGDAWLYLLPMAYKKHPYQWPTIGKEISHIENASLQNVQAFFNRHYSPSNAILTVAGDVMADDVHKLCGKWFADIPNRTRNKRTLPEEPVQKEKRELEIIREVPADEIYMVWHGSERKDENYYIQDLITDILSQGKSSRLYSNLIKTKRLFSTIDAYQTGSIDPGLIIISGRLSKGVSFKDAEQAITEDVEALIKGTITDEELNKVKNKAESYLALSYMNVLNKAMDLAYHELLWDAGRINEELQHYRDVHAEDIRSVASAVFNESNLSLMRYIAK